MISLSGVMDRFTHHYRTCLDYPVVVRLVIVFNMCIY